MSLSRGSRTLNILDLNDNVLEEMLSYFSFYDLAKIVRLFLDECYRILKVAMTNQQRQLNYFQLSNLELNDIYDMASSHFKEHILPAIERNQKLINPSQRIFVPASVLTTLPSQVPLEDRRLIENLRKENSELNSKLLAQEKLLNEHERKLLLLEQHSGLSLSQKTKSPTAPSNLAVASTSCTTQSRKRSLQDDEEPTKPSKRLQPTRNCRRGK